MAQLGQYILSVTAASFLCGILSSLCASGSQKAAVRLVCGLVLTVTILRPFSSLPAIDLDQLGAVLLPQENAYSEEGSQLAKNSMAEIITQNVQAYILDKAAELGFTVSAQVFVSEDTIPVPVCVDLAGEMSPYARLQLEAMIQEDLGITKENIRWMDSH